MLVGYRGVDGSSRLDCPEVDSARAHSRDFLSSELVRAVAAAFRACADRLRDDGVDLAGYSLPERVDDLELPAARSATARIDLVSESAGTRTAMIYAWRYPKSIHRSVMIGVNPPGHFLWDAKTTGEQVRRYAALCAADAGAAAGRAISPPCTRRSATSRAAGGSCRSSRATSRAAAFFGLMNATTDGGGPLPAPLTLDTLVSADQGDASGAWLLSLAAQLLFPRAQVWGDVAAVGRHRRRLRAAVLRGARNAAR